MAGAVLGGRQKSSPGSLAAPSSGSAPGQPQAQPSTEPTCEPGSGPLRQDTTFTAPDAGTTIPFSISLPEDYYTACKQYPVLYALHGRGGDNVSSLDDALGLRAAMAAGVLDDAIIVAPDSYRDGRWENLQQGPAEDNFIKYLIPHVEQNFRVVPGGSSRLLVGFSMGGHGAFRFGLKYPDMFAGVWSVDGAMVGPEDYLKYVEGKTSADFHILSIGGQLNGSRVQRVVDAFTSRGIEMPYSYEDLSHEFPTFIADDEKRGWPAAKFLQSTLGRPV